MVSRALKFLEITKSKLDRASEMGPQLCFIYGTQGEIFFFKKKISSTIKRKLENHQSRSF